jgi:hypothetical protein
VGASATRAASAVSLILTSQIMSNNRQPRIPVRWIRKVARDMARAHAQSGWEHQHRMLKPALASHGRGVDAFLGDLEIASGNKGPERS